MLKAALFDLDGVIFDTEPQYTDFWGVELSSYFADGPAMAQQIKGKTLVQIFDEYLPKDPKEQAEIVARLDDFEVKMHFDYIPGFLEFVEDLRKKGIKTGVVTSSNRPKMENVHRNHPEFKGLFDVILTAEAFTKSKPDPECYLKGAHFFGLKPEECVGFEDSFNGLKAVKAAGMTVVGLATTNSEEAIRPYCDIVIKDYINWIHKTHLFT
ncbi:MAG: HAD family phosphatase [Prevotella sp.]|jgi:beta-phosphoglucomutase|nr:HAD family phosphatase [Prevotella sp.]MCI1281461.1 HAD family phosphatase [Prevotella sp.]